MAEGIANVVAKLRVLAVPCAAGRHLNVPARATLVPTAAALLRASPEMGLMRDLPGQPIPTPEPSRTGIDPLVQVWKEAVNCPDARRPACRFPVNGAAGYLTHEGVFDMFPRRIFLAMALAALTAACVPVAATDPPASAAGGQNDMSFSTAFNRLRAEHGRPPARPDARLTAAAQRHAALMTETGTRSHNDARGRNTTERARAAGHPSCYTVENLAWDWPTSERALAEWSRSPPHMRNLLLAGDVEYGFGVSGRNYVLMVERPCGTGRG